MDMLDQYDVAATLPASDIQRAKRWYEEKLGLAPEEERPDGILYRFAASRLLLYPSEFAGTAKNTAAGWEVDDLDKVMEEMRGRGVTFEEYDMPGMKTKNWIAEIGGIRGSWFKDSEGNILSIAERTS
jgi:catechol 2,3-dioxygenase-like lactoylglutathione lyase family enzyme